MTWRWKIDFTFKKLIQLTHGAEIHNLDDLTLSQGFFFPPLCLVMETNWGKDFLYNHTNDNTFVDTYCIWLEKSSVKGRGGWSIGEHRCKRIAKIEENRKGGEMKVTAEIIQDLRDTDIRLWLKESVVRRCNINHPKMELWPDSIIVISSLSSVLWNP